MTIRSGRDPIVDLRQACGQLLLLVRSPGSRGPLRQLLAEVNTARVLRRSDPRDVDEIRQFGLTGAVEQVVHLILQELHPLDRAPLPAPSTAVVAVRPTDGRLVVPVRDPTLVGVDRLRVLVEGETLAELPLARPPGRHRGMHPLRTRGQV